MRVPQRRGEMVRRMKQVTDNHLSRTKIKRLENELIDLQENQQPEAVLEVRRTGEMGDFSENAAYQMAKGRLRGILNRITSITERLKTAIPIEEGSVDGVIGIGSVVLVKVLSREQTFHIVGSQEVDPTRGRISHSSPLGNLLIGHKIHDKVKFIHEGVETLYEILEVK
jgi:transcription elongation factor GreA